MKKILSLLAAGALALGLIGCSGDLHDSEALSASEFFLRGDMNGWGTTPLTDNGDTWSVTFTATANPQQFAIATGDDSWSTAFRMTEDGGSTPAEYTKEDVEKSDKEDFEHSVKKSLYHGGGMKNATIATKIGADYTLTIKPLSGYIEVSIAQGEIPLDCYVASGSELSKMELTAKNSYKLKLAAAKDGTLSFSVFDGTNSWGIATAETDKKLTLVKNKTVSLTGLKAGKDYVITLDTTNKEAPVLKVVQDIFVCFINGDIAGGDFKKLDVLTETGYRAFTFTYDATNMTAWGGGKGKANFIINDIDSWSGNTKLFADVACELNGDYEGCGKNLGNNATIEGLKDGHKYTVLVDISDTEEIQVKVIEGPALFITGDMDEWKWSLPPLENDENGAYYIFTKDGTFNFKVKTFPAWDESPNGAADTVWADATVGTTKTPAGAKASEASGGNGVVSAKSGDKLYVWYDYDAEQWMAKLVAKQ